MRSKYFLISIVILLSVIFISRLFYLQVIEDKYKFLATSNTRRDYTIYPPRGYIFDRNDSLLVSNQPAYNLSVVYSQMDKEGLDTLALCSILGIDPQIMIQSLEKFNKAIINRKHSRHQPYALVSQISADDYPRIKERLLAWKQPPCDIIITPQQPTYSVF